MDENIEKNKSVKVTKLDEYFGRDESVETNDYMEMELETEWLPMEGESQEECGNRIHKRMIEKYGEDEWRLIGEEVKKMFPDFEEFLRNNSK